MNTEANNKGNPKEHQQSKAKEEEIIAERTKAKHMHPQKERDTIEYSRVYYAIMSRARLF